MASTGSVRGGQGDRVVSSFLAFFTFALTRTVFFSTGGGGMTEGGVIRVSTMVVDGSHLQMLSVPQLRRPQGNLLNRLPIGSMRCHYIHKWRPLATNATSMMLDSLVRQSRGVLLDRR